MPMSIVDLDSLAGLVRDFGPWVAVLVVALYVILKGELKFEYPRRESRSRPKGK